ncbi:hypothetical protein OOT46_26985 [Aquabacterium sp. A7-Y]|uniref:hypothetical protein n=1 Tax=Aquabacterium sp. A7-Y TaxID=1349605 RepID=UPI00223E4250|nr:hypothetical protein [Aquabacterium sp. A7-Y]MCW7541459.1 hypothetical protein [Aquabacterium sp. A7-Y]
MRTKNSKAITGAESDHMQRVKELPCSVCGAPGPSEAHHIEQGMHLVVIPLCQDCHRGSFNGIHGQRRMWLVTKKTELSCLNETIRKLYADRLLARSA